MNLTKSRRSSFFFTTLLSFLVIILLFVTFALTAFAFFKSKYQSELITNNQLVLKNTAERYSTHFSRIKTVLFNYYNHSDVVGFNRQLTTKTESEINYLQAKTIIPALRSDVTNPQLFLDNIMIHFGSGSLVLDKEGSSTAKEQFDLLYTSRDYPAAYWEELLTEMKTFTILPASVFQHEPSQPDHKRLLPVSLRLPGSRYLITAFMDIGKTQQAFMGETDESLRFFVLDTDGSVLIQSAYDSNADKLPQNLASSGVMLKEGIYYFSQKDEEGLTYITAVPDASMAAQLRKLNFTLLVIFLISVGIALAVSFYSSRKISRPVKQLISSIEQEENAGAPSAFHEFAVIQQKIRDLNVEKNEVRSELASKQSILTQYNYINKLKSIHTDINEWKEFLARDENFMVILYELRFRNHPAGEAPLSNDRLASYYRNHLDMIVTERIPASHTFQMEKNQILTVINGPCDKETLNECIKEIRSIFEHNKEYCLATVAVSSWFEHSSQFSHAYRQVLDFASQAKLEDETQIMLGSRPIHATFALNPAQDQELNACLQAGDDGGAMELVRRQLDEMMVKEASIHQFRHFAESVCTKVWKFMEIYKIDQGASWSLKPLMQRLRESCTLDEYTHAFQELLYTAAILIHEKKDEHDPIITFVMNSLHTRYGEDLSLENLADRLHMSSAYLSVYIKEKTGNNFSDHLNVIRINKAQELLSGTELNIIDVGQQIGYRNITSFNRMFKKWTGKTPSEYRRNTRLREN
ncbi:AraC family transcriptional regulator [Paenibacillus sp. FJAT-26967]|uniref:helix-turn-helix domain-containing protein n=1 Tax=Paenibacillus sp. FJAT-26967 TaxID=1729690 RepID=UPI000838D5FC|nr:helix-turn-helix domain-containing protein [Paenibacillus sp. FJAT-26967]